MSPGLQDVYMLLKYHQALLPLRRAESHAASKFSVKYYLNCEVR